ncbi:MAG: 3-hydroxyacyl-CoA dehydrogenase family protein [Acidimicrobiia bacterium]|nr:3-hydroxyacyl-CoA dehydrogenase family protein [Acidimicrobiia bacterium]MYC46518.1 3-hydroxyacyl-CoA dehydrogenase family protein [Acidimicrobiia bacterium]MYI21081.1 3-hydroxyacyl-CoA dehydrogenase family protein [Acidimicrobiia bacterium]
MTAAGPRPTEGVIVLGAGPACPGIAQIMAVAGHRVTLCTPSETLEAAREAVDGGRFGLLAAADAGRISSDERHRALERLHFSAEPGAAPAADLAVVSDPGGPETLVPLLVEVEGQLATGAVLAVDSPGEPLASLSGGLRRPERLVGWHWGWPAQLNKLAEIVAGAGTAESAVEIVVRVARRAGKNPVVIADAPESWGYVTNRVWSALGGEAARIVAEGVAGPEEVDRLLIDGFGWPAGPFGRGSEAR